MPHYIPREAENLLKQILSFAKERKANIYLVGGYLRDLLLARAKLHPDLDFCLKNGAISFGRALARKMNAGFVVLDQENGSCRIVKKLKEKIFTLDFTDFRGKDLKDDLLRRDFTINTLALELPAAVSGEPIENNLVDFSHGIEDISKRIIRPAYPDAFDDDPLRILRAFSLSAMLDFALDKKMLPVLKRKRLGLNSVSRERIRDELFKVCDSHAAFATFKRMDSLKILTAVIPELECMRNVAQGPYHHLDVFKHSLEALRQLEGLFQEKMKNSDIRDYLQEALSGERKRLALLKFACLVHDIGKPRAKRRQDGKLKFYGHEWIGARISQAIASNLKLSNRESDALKRIVLGHLRPGYLGDTPKPTPRAVFRFFRDAQEEAPGILLLSVGDQRATRGRLTTQESSRQHELVCFRLIREYFHKQKEKVVPRLLNGYEIMKEFKLEPSPLVGKVLAHLEELQAIGKVKTRPQALLAARRFLARAAKHKG